MVDQKKLIIKFWGRVDFIKVTNSRQVERERKMWAYCSGTREDTHIF